MARRHMEQAPADEERTRALARLLRNRGYASDEDAAFAAAEAVMREARRFLDAQRQTPGDTVG